MTEIPAVHSFAKLPRHIAIIMDGNGRWAQSQGLRRTEGHRAGVKSIHAITEACLQYGIEALTLFAFSSENWRRPYQEVTFLFELFYETLADVLPKLQKNKIRLRVIGDLSRLSPKLQDLLKLAQERTLNNTDLTLVIAVNYGGQWDILNAAKQLVQQYQHSEFVPDISEEEFSSYLSLADLPTPDLFIRTSGERRISNFLLWQLAYTELYFTEVLWPDFRKDAFDAALNFYASRDRRFGGSLAGLETTEKE